MNGTFRRDFHQLCALFGSQRPCQFHFHIDSIEHAVPGYAFLAVFCMDTRVAERNCDFVERQLFSARIETDGHRGAYAKAREQIIIRIRSGVTAANLHGFICNQVMFIGNDFLTKTAGIAADNDMRRLFFVSDSHN